LPRFARRGFAFPGGAWLKPPWVNAVLFHDIEDFRKIVSNLPSEFSIGEAAPFASVIPQSLNLTASQGLDFVFADVAVF
jgi:hypothetical protein